MDLGYSRNRDLEQNQPQRQEMPLDQRLGQLYNDIDSQSIKNNDVAQVFDRYPHSQQLELKNQIAHAAAAATQSPDPHITRMFISNDGRHIAGWVNKHFLFQVPFPEHAPKTTQPSPAQPIQQRVETVEIDGQRYKMTMSIESAEAIAPPTGKTEDRPATPSGIAQEKNFIGKGGDWLEENFTSPVRNNYEEYVKRPLAEALKIEADDSETTRTFKQGATAVGGTALGMAESVGEGITGVGNLAKEGVSLAYDKASLLAYEHLGIGSEDDARMAKARSDAQLETVSRVWEHTKNSTQEYIDNPAKLKTDLSDGLDSMKAGADRWAEAVGNADLHRAVEEGKPLTDTATLFVGGVGMVKGGMALRRKVLHAAEETAARAKAEFYRETLQDIGDWGKDKNLSPDSFAYKNLAESLARENMPFEDFKALTRTHMDDMTQEQIGQMKRIRDDVPMIDDKTTVTKVMPYEYLEGYLKADNPYNTIGGFVTRKDDYGHLMDEKLSETYKHLALDYPNSAYAKALEEGKDRYLVFEGKLTKPKQTEIPYGKKFGGNHETPPPCTLNGFIACRSDEILPEFEVKTAHNAPQFPEHGSILWVIENGVKRKAAIFDDEKMRFMPNDTSKNK